MSTLLLRNASVFDCDLARAGADVTPTDIAISDGAILAVGHDARRRGLADIPQFDVIDLSGRVVIPGLVNAHLHSNQTLEAGLCDDLALDAYLVLASYGGACRNTATPSSRCTCSRTSLRRK